MVVVWDPGGTLLIFGVCPQEAEIRIRPFQMYRNERKIIASRMPPRTLDRSARLIESGRIPCDEIVTGTFGLDELAARVEGFNENRGSQVKVAIDPWQ